MMIAKETRRYVVIALYTYVPLCVGRSKGKAGIHLKYYPDNKDTFEMYPRKVMHMIDG